MRNIFLILVTFLLVGCLSSEGDVFLLPSQQNDGLWLGVDLSYVNELEDCGAVYSDDVGRTDPYEIMSAAGANVVRLRLWHNPEWTGYSTLGDVRISIKRARSAGMKVLLDFHYSDDWVHPGKQIIPGAWSVKSSDDEIAKTLRDYTHATLSSLADEGLLPDFVQIGNETNTEMLLATEVPEDTAINWDRNVQFLNGGIQAVRDINSEHGSAIGIMLHIAQPENVAPWFRDAIAAGLSDFDIIGFSYYPKWSKMPFSSLEQAVSDLIEEFDKKVVVVETSFLWTLEGNDEANNILGEDSLVAGYAASKSDQGRQLIDLMQATVDGGGLGIVYWEPAWISSNCKTRWGHGSHWENATLFDFEGRLHEGADFLSENYK